MIKLKNILLEKENPYGDILFGDTDDPAALRGMQGTMQPEKDTDAEKKLFKHLEQWYSSAYTGFNSYAEELLSLKKDYPKILDPNASGNIKTLTRVGKLSLHFIDIIKHLNKNAKKIKFELIRKSPDNESKHYMLTLDAPYKYEMLGDKNASSWSSGYVYELQKKFAYGNQITYIVDVTPAIIKNCVMNPVASEVITKTQGHAGNEDEVIYIGKSIEVASIQVPMVVVRGLPNDFTFGNRTNFNDACLINRYVDKEYENLINVIDNEMSKFK